MRGAVEVGADEVSGAVEGGTVDVVVVVEADVVVVLSSRAETRGLPPPHALSARPTTTAVVVAKKMRGMTKELSNAVRYHATQVFLLYQLKAPVSAN